MDKDDGKTQQRSIYELIDDLFTKKSITSLMIFSNSVNGIQIFCSLYKRRQKYYKRNFS